MPGIRSPLMINGVPVAAAPAEIDATTAEQLRVVLLRSAARGQATIVVDMTRTRFCDSAGLTVLVQAHRRAVAGGGELRAVIPADGSVSRVFAITRLDRVIPVFDQDHGAAWRQAAGQERTVRPGPDADGQLLPGQMTRIVLRPLASSLPLGFFAFGMGTILLTAVELHWVSLAQTRPLMIVVLAFVVPLELISGLFAFPARDVGAATGLCLLGAAWAATALTILGGPPGAHHRAGRLLAHAGGHHADVVRGVLRAKPAFGVMLLLGACRFALTGIYQGSDSGPVTATVAGWIGLPLAVFSLYGGLALMLEDSAQRTVLPIGRRGRARSSLEGTIAHQIEAAEREAGVRRQL
jgi:uncharacterized protein